MRSTYRKATVAVLAAVAFSFACLHREPTAADFSDTTGVALDWNKQPELSCVHAEIEALYAAAVAACPPARAYELHERWRGLWVHWQPYSPKGFDCYRAVHGCIEGIDVYADSPRVLVDELGHEAWLACFGTSGEVELPDGGASYDADYAAWVSKAASLPTVAGCSR